MFKGPQGMSLAGNAAAAAVAAAASAAVAAASTSAATAASDKTKMYALLLCNLLWGQRKVPKKSWQKDPNENKTRRAFLGFKSYYY